MNVNRNNMNDSGVVIIAAKRTPIGNFCGKLSTLRAHELGSLVIKELLKSTEIDASEISEVIMGQTLMAGEGQNPARQAALNASIPYTVPAYTVNMLCGSGLKAVVLGYQSILLDETNIVICGGEESMSLAPHCVNLRTPTKFGNEALVDTLLKDALTDAFHSIHMGVTAENIAKKFNISREEQDLFAFQSQKKAENAKNMKFFNNEIINVNISTPKGDITLSEDEYPKHGTTVEGLQKLKPVFMKEGSVTAGNASGVNDGAAAVLLMTHDEARKRDIKPLAKIIGYSQAGVDPQFMGLGPIPAIRSLIAKVGWNLNDVDLIELNEAFAAQSIAVIKELGLDEEKININGGAIALGHPVGASGARVLVTLLNALRRTGKKKGIAALCVGGGMGIAVAVERLEY